MSEPLPRARRRIFRKILAIASGLSLLALVLIGWYVSTDSFQKRIRRQIVSQLEQATGGRVELGELHTIPFRLRIDARNLTVHGREASDQPPFLQIERIEAELKIISLLGTSIGLHSLVLGHPVVHLIDYPDGTTNIPAPAVKYSGHQGPVEELVSLSVSHINVQNGELLWQNLKVPFSLDARDLGVVLNYSLLRQRYESRLTAGNIKTQWQQYPEFGWSADASLVLARSHADISSLTLKSGKSEFHFAGVLQDFHNPQISGSYHGSADLADVAFFLRQKEFRKGTASFEGKGSWNLRDFSSTGTLQAKDVEWSNGKLSMRDGRADATFALTPSRLHLASIKASLLGGNLSGDIDITNWQTSLEIPHTISVRPAPKTSSEGLQYGSVHLQLAGFPISPALDVLSSKKLPLDRLNMVASTSGTVDLLWVGSIRDAEGRMKLDLSPPLRVGPNEIPVRGNIDGLYRASRDELEVASMHLTTPGSELQASGNLAASSSLNFSVTTHNLREWNPLLEAAYGSPKLPVAVHGWASLAGKANGRLSAFSFNGNLEVYDFETMFPPTGRTPTEAVHWDALTTSLQFSSSNFSAQNGSVIHGHTVAHFDLSAALAGGVLTENAPVTLHLDLLNGDVAEFARLTDVERPLTGTVGLSVNLAGNRSNPHGEGHFEVRDGTAYGIAVPSLRGDLKFVDGAVQFNNLEGKAFDASVSGNGSISTTSHDFLLNVAAQNIALAQFPRLQSPRLSVDGVVDFTAQISGTQELPSIQAHVRIKDLALDKERAGDFYVDAVTTGRLLELKAHSDFEKSDLTIGGTVALEKDFPADLKLDFHALNVVSLLSVYLPGKITGQSPIEGTIQLRGPLRQPRELKAVAEVKAFSVEVDRIKVASAEPVRFEVVDQTVILENFHLAGSGTDFAAHGRAHLTGMQEMDLALNGSVNMTLLQSLNPKILARGTVDMNLTATGSLAQPVLQGRLDVKNTFVSHNDFPSGLSDLNGVLLFDRNRIQIQSLQGTTGGGTISLSGSATYQSGAFLLDLGATAQGVRLRYPPGVSSTANAELRLTGSTNSASLSGEVLITKLAVTPGFDFAGYIERSRQTVVFTETDSLTSRLRLDVHVATTPDLQMQTAIARLSGNADLRVRGTADRPAVLGRVEVLEGEISFNGTKYRLERGDVTFANPAKTQPIIDLQAYTRVRDYDITVRFRGDASAPNGLKVTWQSEPQLPEADVIALLALGRTREESANAQSGGSLGFGGEASNLLINEALNSAMSSRIQRLFGVSRIKIDPQGLASETSVVRGPQVTVEQQVASNVTLTYSTNVSVSNQQIIQVEYNLTRNVSIVALRDQNGIVSFDFKIRRRKK